MLKKKNNRHHHKMCNGFTGCNGTCFGFTGNCNDPVGNWSTSIGVLLKPIQPNGICPKTHYRKPYFNDYKLMI